MKNLISGIWYHVQEQGPGPVFRWLCRKARERVVKTGYERFGSWPEYFAQVRKTGIHRDDPVDEGWTEFICPFHRGDAIVGLLCAEAAARQGRHIRMYVANGLKAWLSDLRTDEKITLIELETKIPPALETQPGYNRALEESVRRPEAVGRLVSYRPIGKLEDGGTDLVEYILGQLGLPADTRLPMLSVARSGNREALDSRTGGSPFVLLHPQAGWRIKSLSPEITDRIIQIVHGAGLQVIQIGGEKDRRIRGADGYILEDLSLADWGWLFRKAAAVIGADSWTAHFASLLDVDQILIYGATENRTVGLKRHMEKQESRFMAFGSACELHPCTKLYCRKGGRYCRGMRIDDEKIREILLQSEGNR